MTRTSLARSPIATCKRRRRATEERRHGRAWLNDDLLRDTAVVALLHAGNPAAAREAFDRMGKFSKRKPQDFRVLLLEAHLIAAESRKAAGR